MRNWLGMVMLGVLGTGCLLDDKSDPYTPPTMPAVTPTANAAPLPAELAPLVRSQRPLPPLSGGTLAVGQAWFSPIAVASDPESDRIWLLSPKATPKSTSLQLEEGAEPGRVVLTGSQAYVALRRAGQVAIVDLDTRTIASRVAVCPAPRGLALDVPRDRLMVACAGGELVTVKLSTGERTGSVQLDRDLRDVVIRGDQMLISRFRSADLLTLDLEGHVLSRNAPPSIQAPPLLAAQDEQGKMTPSVGWRLLPVPSGALLVHQSGFSGTLRTPFGGGPVYYGTACNSIVRSSLSLIGGGSMRASPGFSAAMVIDGAAKASGEVVLAVAAEPYAIISQGDNPAPIDPCPQSENVAPIPFGQGEPAPEQPTVSVVSAVAVAFDDKGVLVRQSRSPRGVTWGSEFFAFDGDNRDTGHNVFHFDNGGGLACASCHPEGGDDGRVWNFEKEGLRRTQPLQGGVKGSEPFHWSGDLPTIKQLANEVFTTRMNGPLLPDTHTDALLDWLDSVPALPPPAVADQDKVARGQQVFDSAQAACATCHQGTRYEGNQTVNVGTGEPLQVPPLRGLAYRAPYLHSGCAPTLQDRFRSSCGGGDLHGATSQLSDAQVDDLVAFLESL